MSVFSAFIYADATQHQRSQIERTMIATATMPHGQSLPFLQGFRHNQQRTSLSVLVPPRTPLFLTGAKRNVFGTAHRQRADFLLGFHNNHLLQLKVPPVTIRAL